MATLTVSVPDVVKEWIEERSRTGGYDTSGDYLADLVERDRALGNADDEDVEELRRIVDEGLASGVSDRTMDQIFDEAVERVRARGLLRD